MEHNYKYTPVKYYNSAKTDLANGEYVHDITQENLKLVTQIEQVKSQLQEYAESSIGVADADTNVSIKGNYKPDKLDHVYDRIGKLREQNKSMMAELMEQESDFSKVNSIKNQIQMATKRNKELIMESKLLLRSLKIDKNQLEIKPYLSPDVTKMDKYEKGIFKIQSKFAELEEEVIKAEGE